MTWSIGTKRGKKREERRAKRRGDRKLRKEGPKKQYYGGSEQEYEKQSKAADERVGAAGERYGGDADRLGETADRASDLESEAGSQYTSASGSERLARDQYQDAIAGVSTAGDRAIGLRDQALAANDLNAAAERGILANDAVARQRLAQQSAFMSAAALGRARGMGESGALGVQQAIASTGAADAQLAAQNAVTQAQAANDMRWNAANQQTANALNVADANAGTTLGTAGAVVDATGQLRAADQARMGMAANRQAAFMGDRLAANQAGAGLALENQGQQLQNQQMIEGTQLGVNMQDAQNKFAAAQNRGLTGFLKKTAGAFSAGKDVLDSADYGPTKKLLGGQ